MPFVSATINFIEFEWHKFPIEICSSCELSVSTTTLNFPKTFFNQVLCHEKLLIQRIV